MGIGGGGWVDVGVVDGGVSWRKGKRWSGGVVEVGVVPLGGFFYVCGETSTQ